MTVVPQGQNRLFSFHASFHMACLSSVLLTGPWLSTHCLTLILWICLRLYWGSFIPDRNWFCLYKSSGRYWTESISRPLQNARISVGLRVSLSILQLIQDPINLVCSAISIFLGGKSSPLPTHSLPPGNFGWDEKALVLEAFPATWDSNAPPCVLSLVPSAGLFTENTYLTNHQSGRKSLLK